MRAAAFKTLANQEETHCFSISMMKINKYTRQFVPEDVDSEKPVYLNEMTEQESEDLRKLISEKYHEFLNVFN